MMHSSGVQPSLNGHGPVRLPTLEVRPPRHGSGRIWVAWILGLLSINFTVVGFTVYFAISDPSAAVEPDYYRKALAWDQTARQIQHNRKLGWSAHVAFQASAGGGGQSLRVDLRNKLGEPIAGATIECEYFANTNSGKRSTVTLESLGSEPGAYRGSVNVDRAGLWHVRVRARTAVDVFTHETDAPVRMGESRSGV